MKNGASDALSRGGPISFDHALRLYRRQIVEELETPYFDEEVDEACAQYAAEMREAADIAEGIYQLALSQVTHTLMAYQNGYVQELGRALASGNYTGLAI